MEKLKTSLLLVAASAAVLTSTSYALRAVINGIAPDPGILREHVATQRGAADPVGARGSISWLHQTTVATGNYLKFNRILSVQ